MLLEPVPEGEDNLAEFNNFALMASIVDQERSVAVFAKDIAIASSATDPLARRTCSSSVRRSSPMTRSTSSLFFAAIASLQSCWIRYSVDSAMSTFIYPQLIWGIQLFV
jgi:hypothetical protein